MTRQPFLSSETTASDMRAARLPESNSSSEMSQLQVNARNVLISHFRSLGFLQPAAWEPLRRELENLGGVQVRQRSLQTLPRLQRVCLGRRVNFTEVSCHSWPGHELPDAFIQGAIKQQIWAGAIDAPLTVK